MPKQVDKVNQQSAPDETADLTELLLALTHQIKRNLLVSLRVLPDALTPMEWRALDFFHRHPHALARDLVTRTGRDKAQVARLVRSLVERGLLSTAASADDRRSLQLQLTSAGRRLARQMATERRRVDQTLTAALSGPEQAQLGELLARLHRALRDA